MSAKVETDFTTPDRSRTANTNNAIIVGGTGIVAVAASTSGHTPIRSEQDKNNSPTVEPKTKTPNTVTPPDSSCRDDDKIKRSRTFLPRIKEEDTITNSCAVESPLREQLKTVPPIPIGSPDHDKQVRFNSLQVKTENTESIPPNPSATGQRGAVSRRGGRAASPGRISLSTTSTPVQRETVMEFKTFRSPPRKRDENDTIPSLCSTESNADKKRAAAHTIAVKTEDHDQSSSSSPAKSHERSKPLSISCDASKVPTTSPLKSDDVERSAGVASRQGNPRHSQVSHDTKDDRPTSPIRISEKETHKQQQQQPLKTPTRSPVGGGRFQVLPSLDDTGMRSPTGLFLSPHPPTPSYRDIGESSSFDQTENLKAENSDGNRLDKRRPLEKSPKSRDQDRERFVATPTDFTVDYGKAPNTAGSFDNSNVLAWLQSPTANGLFSPGGLGSIMNTPRAVPSVTESRTPRTPTVSTSFFFSDVAGLPRNSDLSPKPGGGDKRGSSQRGFSNIICISPLASSKAKNGVSQTVNTPTNYRDVFASPMDKSRGLSILGDSPVKGVRGRANSRNSGSRDPSLDAVHMAEKDLMEDEDLSVLLQLASSTPRPDGDQPVSISTSDGTHVFRSPGARRASNGGEENLPALQLPIIGGKESQGNSARLSRKTHSRDHADPNDGFNAPSLSMRSNSGGGGGRDKDGYHTLHPDSRNDSKNDDVARRSSSKGEHGKVAKKSAIHPGPPPYSMPPPHYHHSGDVPPYYAHMPPGMSHGGSMRVVVGAPPPNRKSNVSPPRTYSMGPGEYPPPHHYPPPPHGHYPPHPHMHPHHPYYPPPPPHHRPPPPPHMSLYGGQHSSSAKSKMKKVAKPKQPTKTAKRPVSTEMAAKPVTSAKKPKKSPSQAKKKNKSPQITDRDEREKAAATIKAVNVASGGKNDRAAALAAAILRGVTMRPSGKWQAQLYFAGKSRYIGVFDTREKAALAYEIARERLKTEKSSAEGGALSAKATEAAVNAARKAAFDGVNEKQK